MNIIPAIDIKNGKCVRLFQGNYQKEIIYAEDPVQVAKQWEKKGAKLLHIVDLDGAKLGKMKNLQIIKKIVDSVTILIQVGGGIRDQETVQKLFDIGVNAIVLGTAAIQDRKFLEKIIKKFPKQIVVSLDARNGKLYSDGWSKMTNKNCIDFAIEMEDLGIKKIIYTDISKDGTLTSPNFKEIRELVNSLAVPIIIAGGISTKKDIGQLRRLCIDEIIIGKALYEGRITIC